MIKKITISIFIISALFVFLGCAQKQPSEVKKPLETAEAPQTADEPVNGVATGISDINTVEGELDTSDLEDLDDVLADIENI